MRVAVVGATGMVGQEMLKVLSEYNFPITELYPVASAKSIGKEVLYQDKKYSVIGVEQAISLKPDLALFSAGGDFSLAYGPKFTEVGTVVIDNSSAWRMHPDVKLIVPEVNGHELTKEDKLIANPNCSTIQLVMALKPLHDLFVLKRVLVSTYQSISGTGVKAVEQMNAERSGNKTEMVYPYAIDKNCLPHCDVFLENDYKLSQIAYCSLLYSNFL